MHTLTTIIAFFSESKFAQSIAAFFTSFVASLPQISEQMSNGELLELGQIFTVWGAGIAGTIRFGFWVYEKINEIKTKKSRDTDS